MRLGLAADKAEPPLVLPGYEVLESLGRGGMGEVFRARQESLEREVAVKILRTDVADGAWLPERFEREARTMATVRHPNVVTVHDCLRLDGGRLAIVMELIHGGTLRQRIEASPEGLPLPDVLRWTREIAAGLRVAHAAGLTHRDIKPENILIDDTGAARVSDFGLACSDQMAETRLTSLGRVVGTLGYMAPEQLRGAAADARTDVFSLGVMLYEMVTGQLPQGSFRPAGELRPDLPGKVQRLIDRALRPEADERLPDMNAVLRELGEPSASAAREGFTRRSALALAGVILAGAAVWRVTQPRTEPPSATPAPTSGGANPEDETPWRHLDWPDDPARAAIVGGWKLDGTALVSDEQICIIPIAPSLPAAWRVRMRFRRMTGGHSLAIFFRTPEGTGTFTLASWSKELGGVQVVGGQTIETGGGFTFPLENERAYEWVCEYRAGRVRIWIDGELKQERDIAHHLLTVASPWEWTPGPNSPALLLGSWRSSVRFEWLEIRDMPNDG